MPKQGPNKDLDYTDYKYKYMYNLMTIAEAGASGSIPAGAFDS